MTLATSLASALAELSLTEPELTRLHELRFTDGGHGYDAFGLHPAWVAMGAGLLGPLYHRYFRVQSVGAENIPATGPAILTPNHSGSLPVDGMMLWADVVHRTQPPRVPRAVADHFVSLLPVLGTLFIRGGMVGGSRGNVRQLLESGELMMIFPEGVPGIGKHFRDRYQLQEWRVGHAELAIRHSAPVVPVAIIGAEEQMPQIGRINSLSLFGIPYLPITLSPLPLPVRYYIYYGEPIPLHLDYRPEQADDDQAVREAAARVRVAVERLIERGLAEREGVFS